MPTQDLPLVRVEWVIAMQAINSTAACGEVLDVEASRLLVWFLVFKHKQLNYFIVCTNWNGTLSASTERV